uniref:Uncharacterized protein n=1 Tax=Anopheles atroparvus TaxID=41427 RepID=A0A182INW4_ANOAO
MPTRESLNVAYMSRQMLDHHRDTINTAGLTDGLPSDDLTTRTTTMLAGPQQQQQQDRERYLFGPAETSARHSRSVPTPRYRTRTRTCLPVAHTVRLHRHGSPTRVALPNAPRETERCHTGWPAMTMTTVMMCAIGLGPLSNNIRTIKTERTDKMHGCGKGGGEEGWWLVLATLCCRCFLRLPV